MLNDGKQTTEHLYAWISANSDGIEGIVTVGTDHGMLPLVSTGRELAEKMADYAHQVAALRGVPVRLVRYAVAEELERYEP